MYKQRLNKESFAAFAVLFAIEGLNQIAIYPILPYYIEWTLKFDKSIAQSSRIWMISNAYSFYVLLYNGAQFFSIFFWSICIEKVNFKLMLIMGLVFNIIFFTGSALFPNIYFAFVLRAVHGLFSINLPILKLLLDNYVSFQFEEAKVFVLTSLWIAGGILGMTISSLLASSKSEKILDQEIRSNFLSNYLYFLPFVLISLLNIAAIVVTACHFPTTYDEESNSRKIYYKTMEDSLTIQKKLILTTSESTIYLTQPSKKRTICNKVFRRELCVQKGIGIAITVYFMSNFLFFGIFESVPLIYKDIFEMDDGVIAGLYFSIGLFVMYLADNLMNQSYVSGSRQSLNEARGLWMGICVFFGCGLFIHYISSISYTVKLIVLLLWEIIFMLLFTMAQQSNIRILLFASSQSTRAIAQNYAQTIGSAGRILGSFAALQTFTWGFHKFKIDVLGKSVSKKLEKGVLFILITLMAVMAWLLHFRYSDVFHSHFQKYKSAEEARFQVQAKKIKNYAKAHSSDNDSHVNYAQTDQ